MTLAQQINEISAGLMDVTGAALVIFTKTEDGYTAQIIGPGMVARSVEIESRRQQLVSTTGLAFSASGKDLTA